MYIRNKKSAELLKDLYEKCLATNTVETGLCCTIHFKNSGCYRAKKILRSLFVPTEEDFKALREGGFDTTYWASDLPKDHEDEETEFSELRQTIVCFIIIMLEEGVSIYPDHKIKFT